MGPIAIRVCTLTFLLLCASPAPTVAESHVQARSAEAEFDEIAQLLGVSPGTAVADVGAGGGSWTFLLASRVGVQGHVFATEVKKAQVDGIRRGARARGLENITVILGSQEDMGLPADCCDALLLRLVYHAFDDPRRMRASMNRAMKSRGRVLVVDFRPAPEQLTQEMKDAGFERLRFVERWQDQEGVFAALFRKVLPSIRGGALEMGRWLAFARRGRSAAAFE